MVIVPSSPVKGFICSACDSEFEFEVTKTGQWSFNSIFDCPRCGEKLAYPNHLEILGFIVRAVVTILFFVAILHYDEQLNELNRYLGLFLMTAFTFILIKSFKLKRRRIVLVKHHDSSS